MGAVGIFLAFPLDMAVVDGDYRRGFADKDVQLSPTSVKT